MKRLGLCIFSSVLLLTFAGCKCEEHYCQCSSASPAAERIMLEEAARLAKEEKAADKADTPKPAAAERPAAERNLEGMKEVFDFIKTQKTYYLATVENDQPRVRPFGTIEIFEGNLYIQTGRKKNVSHQIEANGKIELCTFDGTRWLRLSATAVADDRIEAQTHMLDNYPDLKKMYQAGDGNTVVYKLTNVTATFQSFADEPRVIEF